MIKSSEAVDLNFPNCPIRNVLSRVGDKWSILIMDTLLRSPEALRFSVIRRSIPDISQKVLGETLRHLEEDGFVSRKVYAEVPPRVEYTMTSRAKSFMEVCAPVIEWSINNLADILKDRKKANKPV